MQLIIDGLSILVMHIFCAVKFFLLLSAEKKRLSKERKPFSWKKYKSQSLTRWIIHYLAMWGFTLYLPNGVIALQKYEYDVVALILEGLGPILIGLLSYPAVRAIMNKAMSEKKKHNV